MKVFSRPYKLVGLFLALFLCVTTISFALSSSDVSKMRETMKSVVSSFCKGFNSDCPFSPNIDTTILGMTQSDSWWSGSSITLRVRMLFFGEPDIRGFKNSMLQAFKTKEGQEFLLACWITKTKVTVEVEGPNSKNFSFELNYSDLGSEAKRRIEDLKREGF